MHTTMQSPIPNIEFLVCPLEDLFPVTATPSLRTKLPRNHSMMNGSGSQNLGAAIQSQSYSARDNFGFAVNVFNLVQFAHFLATGAPAAGAYVGSRPTENSIKELRKILKSWRRILDKLAPEQKAQFELDHPGEFDSMLEAISDYEERLEDLKVDLRNNPWSRYLPARKSQLTQEYQIVSKGIRNLDNEYYTTTKKYRRNQTNRAAGNTVPPPTSEATTTTDDVEMLPVPTNAAAEATEQRLINQDTIDQTERYRSILRVYSSYNMPPGMQGTYTAIQNFVTSLLSGPDGSIAMMSPV